MTPPYQLDQEKAKTEIQKQNLLANIGLLIQSLTKLVDLQAKKEGRNA